MEILVETRNEILGNGVFWRGPAERISEIRNIPARKTAELVAKDGVKRVFGMWHVSAVTPTDTPQEKQVRLAPERVGQKAGAETYRDDKWRAEAARRGLFPCD